jgi:4-hydroxythreonine-4-phosphate dehydrogenase
MNDLPLALTLGEPAGIGPEITVKAKRILKNECPFFVVGDYNFLSVIAQKYNLQTKKIECPADTYLYLDKLCIIDQTLIRRVNPGHISGQNSATVPENIRKALSYVQTKQASALVTNPINKWALKQNAKFEFEGHTDFLASMDKNNKASIMMLANNDGFRVVPVTIHMPIKQVSKTLTQELIKSTILTLNEGLKFDFKIKHPKILVTGLNPHAGESTAMGFEEIDMIKPAMESLIRMGLNLVGPVAADTAFTEKNRSNFDTIVCMYHDQALIPIKMISFDECINITLGLSFVRTSPDHGTALDIAGNGTANPNSLVCAIKEAHKLSSIRSFDAKKA